MADENIIEDGSTFPEVPYLQKGDPVQGKDGAEIGASNKQAVALAARTAWLKEQFENLVAGGINVIGSLSDRADLDDVDTTTLKAGDAYFIQGEIFVWNTTRWIGSGSLIGPRGITLQGTWPNATPLPDRESASVGDGYIWNNDLWILLPEPGTWESLNVKGPDGKSAYQIARDNGFQGTEPEWLNTLIGKSAYRIWRDLGNEGTEAEFIASLKSTEKGEPGDEGPEGPARAPFSVVGKLGGVEDLPRPGLAEEAYYVGTNLFVWSNKDEDWIDLGRIAGASAYDIWLSEGNQGTEAQFLNSLKSTVPGPASEVPGPKGDAAVPYTVVGAVDEVSDLPTPGDATKAYFVGTNLYVWNEENETYLDLGNLRSPSNYDLAVLSGYNGTQEQWLETLKSTVPGPIGPRGYSIHVVQRIADATQLPTVEDRDPGTGYIANDTGVLYVVKQDRSGYDNLGQFAALNNYQLWLNQGNEGSLAQYLDSLKGEDGDNGKSNYQLWLDAGNEGTLQQYLDSLKGANGQNIQLTGAVDTFADLDSVGAEDQDVYGVRDVNKLYGRIAGNWVDLGTFKGEDGLDGKGLEVIKVLTPGDQTVPSAADNPAKAYVDLDGYYHFSVQGAWVKGPKVGIPGEKGETGTGIRILGSVDRAVNLPNKADAEEGDSWVARDTKLLHTLVEGEWNQGVDITGPASTVPGPKGEDGKDGTSIAIMGAYASLAELSDAQPTGQLGQGYLIGGTADDAGDLAIWTTADGGKWANVGRIRGPQGIQGPAGPGSTVPGPRGMRGASWITLPAGMEQPNAGFSGNVGDWAVSDTFNVYYKTADQGWIFWGRLVAGDVNSPAASMGRVVRQGTEWVKLPVDEVSNPEANAFYVRIIKEGGGTEWTKLTFPDFVKEIVDPEANAFYIRNGKKEWVKFALPAADAVGQFTWKDGSFQRFNGYDLPILDISASANVDPKVNQVVALDNSANTVKTITLADGPKGATKRALTLVITVTGSVGGLTIAASGSTPLGWNNGTPPTLTGSVTNIILYWTGARWIGSLGAVVP